MKEVERAQDLIGSDVYDPEGNKIGKVGNVYIDDASHQPEWVTVKTGMFGMKESFVPLVGSSSTESRINVGVSKARVKGAPRVTTEHGHLSGHEGQSLYRHYGMNPEQHEQAESGSGTDESAEHTTPLNTGSTTEVQPEASPDTGTSTDTGTGTERHEDLPRTEWTTSAPGTERGTEEREGMVTPVTNSEMPTGKRSGKHRKD